MSSSNNEEIPLFKKFPKLKAIPHVKLINFPTPVEKMIKSSEILGGMNIWVKRDDLTNLKYGGNKPRKYEFVIPYVKNKKKKRILTVGGLGTNHGLANAIIARDFGIETSLYLSDQPLTQHVRENLLCDYYFKRFGVDTRGVRYPGIISNETLPGGGTTDYAVDIYYEAIKKKAYTCFLKAGTFLDMMYMPDALTAAVDLMEADPSKLIHRNAFNISTMSFDPEMLAASIRKHIPEFTIDYDIDPVRQAIAESWPNNMDDSAATEEWGWHYEYDLDKMTEDMLSVLSKKLK